MLLLCLVKTGKNARLISKRRSSDPKLLDPMKKETASAAEGVNERGRSSSRSLLLHESAGSDLMTINTHQVKTLIDALSSFSASVSDLVANLKQSLNSPANRL